MGSSMPPFQSSMSSTLGQTGIGSAMDPQKRASLFSMENKTTSNSNGSSAIKNNDLIVSGGPGNHSMDHSTGIKSFCTCSYISSVCTVFSIFYIPSFLMTKNVT